MKIMLGLCAVFFSSLLLADTVLFFETTNPKLPETIEIKDRFIRLSNPKDYIVTIFDKEEETLTFLNEKELTYKVISRKAIVKILKKARKWQRKNGGVLTEKQLAKVKKAFEKQGLDYKFTITSPTTKKVKSTQIKGIDCDLYTVKLNKQLKSSHCIASARYLGVNSVDFHTYLLLMQLLKQLAFTLDNIDLNLTYGFLGMPLVSYDENNHVMSKLYRISGNNIEKDIFVIPQEYKKAQF